MGYMKLKVLIIEDERSLAIVMSRVLIEAGWQADWASDGIQGLEAALKDDYAAVLLDVMLPGMSGWEVLTSVRAQRPTLPILLTTALDDIDDKVRGLHLGADDYLVKPFELKELIARLETIVRRSQVGEGLVTRVEDLSLDRRTRSVTRQGKEIHLTRREYDLLEALASNHGLPVDRETLQVRVWTDDEAFGKSVEVFMRTLKQKVDVPFGHDLIHAPGNGSYRLGEPRSCAPVPEACGFLA